MHLDGIVIFCRQINSKVVTYIKKNLLFQQEVSENNFNIKAYANIELKLECSFPI